MKNIFFILRFLAIVFFFAMTLITYIRKDNSYLITLFAILALVSVGIFVKANISKSQGVSFEVTKDVSTELLQETIKRVDSIFPQPITTQMADKLILLEQLMQTESGVYIKLYRFRMDEARWEKLRDRNPWINLGKKGSEEKIRDTLVAMMHIYVAGEQRSLNEKVFRLKKMIEGIESGELIDIISEAIEAFAPATKN